MITARTSGETLAYGMPPLRALSAPHRRLAAVSAAVDAARVVRWIRSGAQADDRPDEHRLFAAMHVSAYHAATSKPRPGQRDTWLDRWRLIREYIVEQNLGLVYSMMERVRGPDVLDRDDLVSEAMLVLAQSVEHFDPWRGFRFSTYACNSIVRALYRRIRSESRRRRLFPVQHEERLDLPEPVPEEDDLPAEKLRGVLKRKLNTLSPLESTIIAKRFPKDNGPPMTYKAIGQTVGLSKERIRQIQNDILHKLKKMLAAEATSG